MHDPQTLAFQIKSPFKKKSKLFPLGYRNSLIDIWHVDPEKDGTDDSCGWFMRARHGSREVLEKIVKRFEFDWDSTFQSDATGTVYPTGYFFPIGGGDGAPFHSVHAIALNLFFIASIEVFGSREKAARFVRKNLFEILLFAENPTDSLHEAFTRKFAIGCKEPYTKRHRDERLRSIASCIYAWILRNSRPWYKHPRWHFWHWKIHCALLLTFKRWAFSRCAECGKGFKWGESCVGTQWDSTGPMWFKSETHTYHDRCCTSDVPPTSNPPVEQSVQAN